MTSLSKKTKDHEEIKNWAEQRDGKPAQVANSSAKKETGILRIDFPPYDPEKLEEISWDDFFKKFDAENLVFLYQDETSEGGTSYFNKFIYEEDDE